MQTIHDTEEPATMSHDSSQPRVPSLFNDKGSLTLNELMVLCTTLSKKVEDLQNDLKQTKLTYGVAYTKLIMRVKKLKHKGRTSADTKVLLEQEEPTELVEDPGSGEKGEKEISTAEVLVSTASVILEVSTTTPKRQAYIRRSAEKRKDKGKAIMKDDESVQKKTKKDAEIAKQLQEEIDIARQEQEKYDLAQALELQKELDKRKEGMSYEDIRPIFERVWDQNQSFVPKDSEIEKEVMKRSGFDFQKPHAKRQKVREVLESVEE
ncbi:hypothetical protein Tco_1308534 [Tanacetum coccineum]